MVESRERNQQSALAYQIMYNMDISTQPYAEKRNMSF